MWDPETKLGISVSSFIRLLQPGAPLSPYPLFWLNETVWEHWLPAPHALPIGLNNSGVFGRNANHLNVPVWELS